MFRSFIPLKGHKHFESQRDLTIKRSSLFWCDAVHWAQLQIAINEIAAKFSISKCSSGALNWQYSKLQFRFSSNFLVDHNTKIANKETNRSNVACSLFDYERCLTMLKESKNCSNNWKHLTQNRFFVLKNRKSLDNDTHTICSFLFKNKRRQWFMLFKNKIAIGVAGASTPVSIFSLIKVAWTNCFEINNIECEFFLWIVFNFIHLNFNRFSCKKKNVVRFKASPKLCVNC